MKRLPGVDWRAVYGRLRIARLTLGVTEAEAAAAAGITLRTYRKWEPEFDRPTRAGPIVAFASTFNVSLDWLIRGEGGWLGRHLTGWERRQACDTADKGSRLRLTPGAGRMLAPLARPIGRA